MVNGPVRTSSAASRSGGAILLLVLFFLLLLGLTATGVVRTGTLQLKMALNEQLQLAVLREARALAGAVSVVPGNFSLGQPVATVRCLEASPALSCDLGGLASPSFESVLPGVRFLFSIERKGPEVLNEMPPGLLLVKAPTGSAGTAALYEVVVTADGTAAGLASADVVRGVLLWLPHISGDDAGSVETEPDSVAQIYSVYWRYPGFDPL